VLTDRLLLARRVIEGATGEAIGFTIHVRLTGVDTLLFHTVCFAGAIALKFAVLIARAPFDAGAGLAHLEGADLLRETFLLTAIGAPASAAADISFVLAFINLADLILAAIGVLHAFGGISAGPIVLTDLRDVDTVVFGVKLTCRITTRTVWVTGPVVAAEFVAGDVTGIALFGLLLAIHHLVTSLGFAFPGSRIALGTWRTLQTFRALALSDACLLTDAR
jgi:hypothetical protein